MAQKKQTAKQNSQPITPQPKTSFSAVKERMNNLMSTYSNLTMDALFSAFGRAAGYWNNMPSIQNSRVKAISPLPCDYSKEQLGEFLRTPQNSELQLQQVSEGLKWTNYSWYKLIKSYVDMLQFHTMALPQHATADEIKSDVFKREYRLVNKLIKALNPREIGRKTAMQAGTQGKVFYVPRYSVDKSHNKINYFFMQPLPASYCTIIGQNNISGWTVSFNLMYFCQPGTDYRQFGDLFTPYLYDFDKWQKDKKSFKGKFVYASRNNADAYEYEIKAWQQNSRWFYYVSLPIDKVWTFEIDSSTAIVASPFSGLMQTFAQQADYEAAQLSLILNPLIKILTGEIPYYTSNMAKEDDGFRLSLEGRALFEAYFNSLMAQTNTGGVGFYTAPVENIKSHDFLESPNANSVSQSFLNYGMAKTNMTALLPTTDNPHMGAAEYSAKLENQFATQIYRTMEKMLEYIVNEQLGLRYEYSICIFGSVYTDDILEANCLKRIATGDLTARLTLLALHDMSLLDAITASELLKETGYLDLLIPPATSYTQSANGSSDNGAPTKDKTEVEETVIEKKSEGEVTGRN